MTHPIHSGVEQDEYFVDTPAFRTFIEDVRSIIAREREVDAALNALQPRFAQLLADPTWLPEEFASPYEGSGMGGGIASWLLFRAGDKSLSLISLVVPPGSETPIHDHLAWGFVGLYRGEQRETVYARQEVIQEGSQPHTAGSDSVESVRLTVQQVNDLRPGDFYRLVPPDGDIHSVKTTSSEPSVSIHLLTNDIGCIIRHSFDLEQATVRAFRSGYSNVACEEEAE